MFYTDYTNTSMNNLRLYLAWFKGKFRVEQRFECELNTSNVSWKENSKTFVSALNYQMKIQEEL